MKIVITSQGDTLDSLLDPRFGRAPGFIVYDLDTDSFTYQDNGAGLDAAQGAGLQAAMAVGRAGATAIVTGHVGPKAFTALDKGGVKVFLKEGGTVREGIEDFKARRLAEANGADRHGHW